MKRSAKRTPSKNITEIDRSFVPPSLRVQCQALNTFLTHRRVFSEFGMTDLAAAAERAWIGDAALLAMMPAQSAEEATCKIEHLCWMDAIVADGGVDTYSAASTLIATAIEAERQRWRLSVNTQH